jgi:tetratricopeptide (TPR) repeat protein
VRAGDASPLPWIERTLDRAIVYGPAHLLLARWLASRSPSQARLEYRLTLEQAPELGHLVQPAFPALVKSYDDATELVPRGPGRGSWLGVLSASLAPRLPATSRRLDELALELRPDDPEIAERLAREAVADVLAGDLAPWCAGDLRAACVRVALERTARLMQLQPNRCAGYAMHARVVLEDGSATRALKELRTAAGAVTDRIACFEELADLATRAKSDEAVTLALNLIGHAGCADDAECVQNLRFVASRESARGNPRSALAALERAREKAPQDDGLVEEVASLAATLDLHVESLRAYQTLAQRHPGDARWEAAVAAQRAAIVESGIPR